MALRYSELMLTNPNAVDAAFFEPRPPVLAGAFFASTP
jgi:hypothetical protein